MPRLRLPLTTWFIAIHLVTQSKHGISLLELARQLGVSQNTAWQLKHKLMQAMRERDERVPLAGIVQVDDAYWGGQDAVRRCGRNHRGRPAPQAAHEPRQGLPQGRPARLGRTPPPTGHQGAIRRLGLLPGCHRGRLRAPRDCHRRGLGQLRGTPPAVGQHNARQRQAIHRRHLPRDRRQARAALPGGVLLPLQPPLPARQSCPPPRVRLGEHSTDAVPPSKVG